MSHLVVYWKGCVVGDPPPPFSSSPPKKKFATHQYVMSEPTADYPLISVFQGHVDAGKSTLMGHLLFLLGDVSKKAMHKYPLIIIL